MKEGACRHHFSRKKNARAISTKFLSLASSKRSPWDRTPLPGASRSLRPAGRKWSAREHRLSQRVGVLTCRSCVSRHPEARSPVRPEGSTCCEVFARV